MSKDKIDSLKTYDQPEPDTEIKPGLGIGKYELLEKIGEGGMGIVWKAHDRVGNRLVALKFVPPELGRVEKEMERMRVSFGKIHDLHHPAICPIFGLEKEEDFGYYLVMKYLEGETLDDYRLRKDPKGNGLPLNQVIELLRPVAQALDYAHRNHVIHRDIKPSNIFLAENPTGIQVIDFGLADEFRSSLSRVSKPGEVQKFSTAGTPAYMAPEQWMGHPQKAMTDQYALATVAYELLAGHLPFSGNNIQNAVLRYPPEPISEIPESANAALQRALAKKGKERFVSCQDFMDALAGREPATASPKSPKKTAVAPGVESGKILKELQGRIHVSVGAAVFSLDGKKIITVNGNVAQVWDVELGKVLQKLQGRIVEAAVFSRDGKNIITVGRNVAQVWDVELGKELKKSQGHIIDDTFQNISFSLDGKRIITTDCHIARIWMLE